MTTENQKPKTVAQAITSALSGIIMIVCVLVYVVLGITISFWHPGWLIIVGGALFVGILNIIANLISEIKTIKENQENNK